MRGEEPVFFSKDRPISTTDANYNIQCKAGDLEPYLLVHGALEKNDKIASSWDESREVVTQIVQNQYREI